MTTRDSIEVGSYDDSLAAAIADAAEAHGLETWQVTAGLTDESRLSITLTLPDGTLDKHGYV